MDSVSFVYTSYMNISSNLYRVRTEVTVAKITTSFNK